MPANILIFVPCFGGQLTSHTFTSVVALHQAFAQKGIGGALSTFSFPDIGELRNMALSLWYDTMPQSTHLLFVDADMGFTPELVLDMLLFDHPMVGALYPKRAYPISWAASGGPEKQAPVKAGFMKVEGLGMGCFLIRRDAVTKMLEAYPELSDERLEIHSMREMIANSGGKRLIRAFDPIDDPKTGRISEDLSFCRRWNDLGGEVWAAVMHRVQHVGQHVFEASYIEHVAEKAKNAPALAVAAE